MKTMIAVNAVQLVILVWTFTVCQADDDISVSCEDVTGTVGEEVTFSCNVSLKKSDCCIIMYKFLYPEKNDSICREEPPPDPCEQRNSFTCNFSLTTVMTGQFRFFVQTTCGQKYTEFTVNITEPNNRGVRGSGDHHGLEEDPPSNHFIIAVVVGCFIITIIIFIMTIIYKTKLNYKTCVQKKMMMTTATVQK